MEKELMEQTVHKPLKQCKEDGRKLIAKVEDEWFSLPEETRDRILIESVDSAELISHLPIDKALQVMLKVGYYFGVHREAV